VQNSKTLLAYCIFAVSNIRGDLTAAHSSAGGHVNYSAGASTGAQGGRTTRAAGKKFNNSAYPVAVSDFGSQD